MIVQKFKQPKFFEVGRIVRSINKKPESKPSTNKKHVSGKPPPSNSGSKSKGSHE